ncbi:MAG: twin-arginine translocase TatA/TatE family subunit [Pseudomonadota bacterium]|nr:twin-arginine translocase TatA/TatE family subunit [Pseudomonadota bacterium]
MGTFSIWHWVIVLIVVLVLFGGRGKLSSLMGDMAKGINAFKKGLKDKDLENESEEMKTINAEDTSSTSDKKGKEESTKG